MTRMDEIATRLAAGTVEPAWPRRDIDREGTCDGCAGHKHLVAAYDDPSGGNEPWLCAGCAADNDLLNHAAGDLRYLLAAAVGWRRDAAEHAARATASGYRLNGVIRERDRLASRLAEVERERDALESLHDRTFTVALLREHQVRVRTTGYGGAVTHCSCGHDGDYIDHMATLTGQETSR